MNAKQWALEQAGNSEADFFKASYATDTGLKNELVLVCRLPAPLTEKLWSKKPELYLRPSVSSTELDDGRHILVAWFGLRFISAAGEARWLARINPCAEGSRGFETLAALPAMDEIKVHIFAGEDPLVFGIQCSLSLKTQLARVQGATTGCDHFTHEEFDGAVHLQLDDKDTKEALLDELFPDHYPST